jgi:hypothetical protein
MNGRGSSAHLPERPQSSPAAGPPMEMPHEDDEEDAGVD